LRSALPKERCSKQATKERLFLLEPQRFRIDEKGRGYGGGVFSSLWITVENFMTVTEREFLEMMAQYRDSPDLMWGDLTIEILTKLESQGLCKGRVKSTLGDMWWEITERGKDSLQPDAPWD
jgi:hypothetical protein